jgi:hypothetical protein
VPQLERSLNSHGTGLSSSTSSELPALVNAVPAANEAGAPESPAAFGPDCRRGLVGASRQLRCPEAAQLLIEQEK